MGRVYLMGPDGSRRAGEFFGEDCGQRSVESGVANDGVISDIEVSLARERLENEINSHICGYGGPLGLGGWGGISELCVQPWNMGGPARENTPDGFSMPVTLHFTEDYSVPTGILFFRDHRSITRDVDMTMRWESGRIRLYQCTPPAYAPPPPPPPPVDMGEAIASAWNGVQSFFSGTEEYASSAIRSLRRMFS